MDARGESQLLARSESPEWKERGSLAARRFGMLSGRGPIIQKVPIVGEELAVRGTRKTGRTTVGSSRR